MAQQKVVDLVIQHGSVQIVQRNADAPLAPAQPGDVHTSLARLPAHWPTLLVGGVALAAFGALGLVLADTFLGLMLANTFVSGGALIAVLGLLKRWSGVVRPAPALPASGIDARVLAERCRRVRGLLHRGVGEYTFERLVRELKWTQAAMLSTLLHMKEQGEIVEDLNLDTGEWVYSLAVGLDAPTPASTSPMLEERRATEAATERQR